MHRVRPGRPSQMRRPQVQPLAPPGFGAEKGFSYDPDDHGYGKSNSSSSDPFGWGDSLAVGCHTEDYLAALRLIAHAAAGYEDAEAAAALQTLYWNNDYRSQSVLRCAREILGAEPSWGPPPRAGNRPVW